MSLFAINSKTTTEYINQIHLNTLKNGNKFK